MKLFNLFSILLVLFSFLQSNALADDSCVDTKITLFFGNGILNSFNEAQKSRYKLQNFLKASIANNESERALFTNLNKIKVSYNLSEGPVRDIFQASKQRKEEDQGKVWRYLSNLDVAPDWFRELVTSVAIKADEERLLVAEDLQNHVESYKAELEKDNKILIVAHSQGNFYANSSRSLLILDPNPEDTERLASRFSILAVASPASYVASFTPHTTNTDDRAMNAIRFHFPDTLPGNTTNTRGKTLSNHEFVEAYLNGNHSSSKIKQDFLSIVDKIREADMQLDNYRGPVHFSEKGFLPKSMTPMWKWINAHNKNPRPLKDHECIAVAAFGHLYDNWGIPCADRSLDFARNWITECHHDLDPKNGKLDVYPYDTYCYFYGFRAFTAYFRVNLFERVLDRNPECKWKEKELPQKLTDANAQLAREFLANPN